MSQRMEWNLIILRKATWCLLHNHFELLKRLVKCPFRAGRGPLLWELVGFSNYRFSKYYPVHDAFIVAGYLNAPHYTTLV